MFSLLGLGSPGAISPTWGNIGGSIANQADLQTAIGATTKWTKVTIGFAAIQAAALTSTGILLTLPIKGIVHQALCNVSTAFSGGSIATCTATVGKSGSVSKYITAINLAATGQTAGQSLANPAPESLVATTAINVYATATVANLSALTQGSVDIWLLVSTLP